MGESMDLKGTNEVCPTTALKEYSQGRNENCDKDLGEGMSVEGMEEREEI
jgi:hypothetical protein